VQPGFTEEPGTCVFETPLAALTASPAEVSDSQGRRNQDPLTRLGQWGAAPRRPQGRAEQLTLIPDKETYRPGDTRRDPRAGSFQPG
jgi:hypothetical protein